MKIPDSTNLPQIGRFPGLVFSYPETAQFMLTHSPRCLQIANIYGRFLTRSLRQAGFSCKHRRNVLLIFADGLGRISENSDVNLISGIVFGQIVVGGSREKRTFPAVSANILDRDVSWISRKCWICKRCPPSVSCFTILVESICESIGTACFYQSLCG